MNSSQREKIKAASEKWAQANPSCKFPALYSWAQILEIAFDNGAEFALKMVEEELKNSIDKVCDSVECVCHETNSRNCPVHQNWSRESDGSVD